MSNTKFVIRFNRDYFILTMGLFLMEIYIAKYVSDYFIRPYAGDYLVVILIYCFLKTFISVSPVKAATLVLFIAYAVEYLQYLHLADTLGLAQGSVSRILLGDYFTWIDILAYSLGTVTILFTEYLKRKFYTRIDKK